MGILKKINKIKLMKILHINYDNGLGGASRATLRLHQALLKKNKIKFTVYLKKK